MASNANQSVERAAVILKTLSEHGSLGVTEIARQVGLQKSIAYRLLASLKAANLVRTEPATRKYTLGYGLLEMTAKWLEQLEVRRVALPTLRRLRHDSNETIGLNVRDGDCRVTVERIDTAFEVRFMINLGHPLPMYEGAAGKSILAFLPDDEIDGILARADLSNQAKKRLHKDLAKVRALGLSDTRGERVAGTRSISAPIFNFEGAAIASVSVLALETRMDKKSVVKVYRLVKEAAKEITNAMGCKTYPAVA